MSMLFTIDISANQELDLISALEDVIEAIRLGHYAYTETVRGIDWDYNLSSSGEWTWEGD